MANKNTLKVRRRREKRQYDRAMEEFLAFASKRQALITFGSTHMGEYGVLQDDCFCSGLEPLAAYSLRQAIETYTDCKLVPSLLGVCLRVVQKGDLPQTVDVQHTHIVDKSGLDSTLKDWEIRINCPACEMQRRGPKDNRPFAVIYYDKYTNFFSKAFLHAFRDWAIGQLDAIKSVSWMDDEQWNWVLRHAAFGFTPNLEKSRSLVVIK